MHFQDDNLDEVAELIRAGGTSGVGSGASRSVFKSSFCDELIDNSVGRRNRRTLLITIGCLAVLFVAVMASKSGSHGTRGPVSKETMIEFVDPESPTSAPEDTESDQGSPNESGDQIIVVEPKPEPVTLDTTDPPAPQPIAVAKPKPKAKAKAKAKPNNKIPRLEPDKEAGPIDDEKRDTLSELWGSWHFWDGEEDARPKDDYLSKYPNRDIPGDDFPPTSWQTDSVFVNHYLNDADKLIDRAMESIFTEYGHGKPLPPEVMASRMKMFHWEKIDLATEREPPPEFRKHGARDIGGWTTKRSFEGLVRRLLHAMLTRDTFTVVLAGHSAAQGQGNHFRQSYAMQFHRIMKPIFERLGVKLITRNMAQGGLGTLQGGMGARDIYGSEIDLFLWDSGMTEGGAPHHIDLVIRQVLMSGNRVPVVWGAPFDILKLFHEEADADVGEWGTGFAGLPETTSEEQSLTLPYAARNMKCSSERQDLCNANRFSSVCWIDRTDGIVPTRDQPSHPRGQVKWHPGWRPHQLMGRVLAFAVLEGLEVAVNSWMENTMTGQPLDDEYWHVTDYYENIRNKIRNLDQTLGHCPDIAKQEELPLRMCFTPMKAKTQYTPRANYEDSALTSIVKAAPSGYVPINGDKRPALYDGPDVHNPAYDIPEGEVDVLSIVMGRRRLEAFKELPTGSSHSASVKSTQPSKRSMRTSRENATDLMPRYHRRLDDEIVPGEGWDVALELQGYCDGTYDSVCAHAPDEECFLLGHPDGRGAIVGGDLSGWLVMTLKSLRQGIIVLKLQTWHVQEENPRARSWSTVDGKRRHLGASSVAEQEAVDVREDMYFMGDLAYPEVDEAMPIDPHRNVKMRNYDCPPLPDTFAFDYAINGKITTLNSMEFLSRKKNLQRVVETLTLLDDPEFTEDDQDVEVAFRLRGAGRPIVFGISHIYWA